MNASSSDSFISQDFDNVFIFYFDKKMVIILIREKCGYIFSDLPKIKQANYHPFSS